MVQRLLQAYEKCRAVGLLTDSTASLTEHRPVTLTPFWCWSCRLSALLDPVTWPAVDQRRLPITAADSGPTDRVSVAATAAAIAATCIVMSIPAGVMTGSVHRLDGGMLTTLLRQRGPVYSPAVDVASGSIDTAHAFTVWWEWQCFVTSSAEHETF